MLASIVISLRFEKSIFVPEKDFGGTAKIILSELLHFISISAIAATKQFYLIISLLIYSYDVVFAKWRRCFKK